jgi:hypothetical protein
MHPERPSLEELNAYVDGELSAERTADVARHIAQDPAIARQVAALTRLRSVLPHAIDVPALEMPAQPKRHRLQTMTLAAACVALLLLVSGMTILHFKERTITSAWQEAAIIAHDAWHLPPADRSGALGGVRQEAVIQDSHPSGAYVPDLSASKLSIVFVDANRELLGRPAIVIGYAGTRGCKVTLLASIGASQEADEFRFLMLGENAAYAWGAGEVDYLLIAKGMDRQRFDLIAESVFRATNERSPFDEDTRTALLDNRMKSKLCMA